MMPILPLELQEEVIQHLHNDTLTLSSCSCTCKAWLTKSRSLLFHRLSYSLYQDDWSLDDLATFLREHPEIGALIREFCVYHTSPYPIELEESYLCSTVELLPNLQNLTVGQPNMSFASYTAPLSIAVSGGILLFDALSRCSHLQTLAFIHINYMNYPPCAEPSYPDGLFSQLEKLEIGFATFQGDTFRNLLSTVSRSQWEKHPPPVPRPSRLKRLMITLWEIDDTLFEAYGNFLKDAGEFLEELVLVFSAGYWLNDADAYAVARKSVDLFNVASCLNLSMLELRLSLPGTYRNWQWPVVHATLSAIPPEHLPPTIKLCLWGLSYPDSGIPMDPTPLVEFDQIVGHAPRVQRVVITSSTASELLHTTVCPHFVTLTSKKRLFVE